MALHINNDLLVKQLESTLLLDGRYEDIRWVNRTPSGEQSSCFSLVFSATDIVNSKKVALKFYDLAKLGDRYRIECFEREHEILQKLLNQYRCLQLTSAFSTYNLIISLPDGTSASLPCSYFAVDWVEDDLEEFFLNNNNKKALDRLYLFNEIVLGIEALHQREVFHRDIKQDNLRAFNEKSQRVVVAIDLGASARFTSKNLKSDYSTHPGAPIYAAPEARCGLSGNRFFSHHTDKYALGCLLFELFNKDFFYIELMNRNPHYEHVLAAMTSYLHGCKDEEDQFRQWKVAISKLGNNISPVKVNNYGSDVPHAVAQLLNEMLEKLTHHNFSNRPTLSWVRARTWSAIRTLESNARCQRNLLLLQAKRDARRQKVENAQSKLDNYKKGELT